MYLRRTNQIRCIKDNVRDNLCSVSKMSSTSLLTWARGPGHLTSGWLRAWHPLLTLEPDASPLWPVHALSLIGARAEKRAGRRAPARVSCFVSLRSPFRSGQSPDEDQLASPCPVPQPAFPFAPGSNAPPLLLALPVCWRQLTRTWVTGVPSGRLL